MDQKFYDVKGQQIRRQKVYDLLVDYTLDYFDENGNWIREGWNPSLRERLWFCFPYLGSGKKKAVERANTIIKTSEFKFCHFSPMACLQLLVKYHQVLDRQATEILKGYLKDILQEFRGDDLDFVGVNDNFPCMSTYTALMGGKLFDDSGLYEIGKKRLHQLKELLTRRGETTEYASPTYTPIQVYAMAEIANATEDREVQQLALQCEERIWVNILGHYHTTTFQMAGPYSRAYTVDCTGHTYLARFSLYALLGDQMLVNPMNTLFVSPKGQRGEVIHVDAAFMQVTVAWLMSTQYHCPTYLVEWTLHKIYPFEFKATMEYSSSTDALPSEEKRNPHREDKTNEYAAGAGTISTYMTEDYALGVASNEFHNGSQTDSFHILYRRHVPVKTQNDMATVYCRYIINGKRPGENNDYPQFNIGNGAENLWDEGRKIGVHYQNTAMMLYKPKIYGCKDVISLKLSLIFPAQYGPVEEIWLGEQKVEALHGQSVQPCPIFIKDGPVYMAFHPLLLTDDGREAAVKVEKINDYVMVSLYNYQGSSRDFARRGFLLTGNGFVAEVGSEKENGNFEEFKKRMKKVAIQDTMFSCVHGRQTYLRRTKYEREGLTLACEYSPVSEGIKYISVNGKILECPILKATGLHVEKLPFLCGE